MQINVSFLFSKLFIIFIIFNFIIFAFANKFYLSI